MAPGHRAACLIHLYLLNALPVAEKRLTVENAEPLMLFGFNDVYLRRIEAAFPDTQITARGTNVLLRGEPERIARIEQVISELIVLLNRNGNLTENDVETVLALTSIGDGERPNAAHAGRDAIVFTPGGGVVRAKTPGQQRLVEKARGNDIVFAMGPAGTGKTYTAVALAVAALKSRQAKKIVLARPAVEAGERLGFLPGDLKDKIDPYLRPLYDALEDMMPRERLAASLQDGTIEIAPLAFMRGRAQPLDARVLTPEGWCAIGMLGVGDFVVGSDGRPTRVEGVYPQGEKAVYEVEMTDGARTRCCAEHLWTVYTASDRRRGKPPRTLELQEMLGRERVFHQYRFELPLLSAPVAFPAQPTLIEPYALGLLLGDGCITGSTSPTFATGDPELAEALEARLEGVTVRHKAGPDYVITTGRRGNRPHPLTTALRSLGLCGTRSGTKFIPEHYLFNTAEVRLSLLQGLLDTDGGPVLQAGRTARIQYTTTSPRLADDVAFLVRSLGGVDTRRVRRAEGRTPGRAKGRPVLYRADALVLDIRLPAGLAPFRLGRKAERYASGGQGKPMRHIRRITPAGETETVCIRVAAEDALYVTDDLILTHNTLNTSFVILDEAQNATIPQMKMFLTRLGAGSRAIITGDATQTDLPSREMSGLAHARGILDGVEGIAVVEFDRGDVVRHRLVKDIIEAYERAGVQASV